MKNSIKWLSLSFAFMLFMGFTLTGCNFDLDDLYDIDSGFDEEEVAAEEEYIFDVSADSEHITINLANIGYLGDEAHVVALQPYQYFSGETMIGLAEEIDAVPYIIGTYDCGTEQTLVVDRYMIYYPFANQTTTQPVEGQEVSPYTDGIGLKYYVLDSADNILVGPKYCTEIEPVNNVENPIQPKSIKGVMCEDTTYYMDRGYITDLGCSWVQYNFVINNMIIPNERYDGATGQVTLRNWKETKTESGALSIVDTISGAQYGNVDYIDYNGQRYYFDLNAIAGYDNSFKAYNAQGIKVTAIVLTLSWLNNGNASHYMAYPGLLTKNGIGPYMQNNTSTMEGANYWGAFMEFLGKHYSQQDENGNFVNGFVDNYVIGNEVDYAQEWNAIVPSGHVALDLHEYLEEYERWIRIANQSLKKYYSGHTVLVSITHNWYTSSMNEYAPKNILDYLSAKTLAQGNYNWGIALHPYGADLPVPDYLRNDTRNVGESAGMNGSLNTSKITFTNLEVLELYLEQKGKLCNGEIRPVHITEGGVCGPTNTTTGEKLQAAGIAYAYYKCSQLPCIKSFQYYRFRDHPVEVAAGLYTGIMYADAETCKEGYYVLKHIDNGNMRDYADQYLPYISWTINNQGFGYGFTGDTWQDFMTVFPSRFDWSTHWDESKIWPETALRDPS